MQLITDRERLYCTFRGKGYSRAESARKAGYRVNEALNIDTEYMYDRIGNALETGKRSNIINNLIRESRVVQSNRHKDTMLAINSYLQDVIQGNPTKAVRMQETMDEYGYYENVISVDSGVYDECTDAEKSMLLSGNKGVFNFDDTKLKAIKAYLDLNSDNVGVEDSFEDVTNSLYAGAGLSFIKEDDENTPDSVLKDCMSDTKALDDLYGQFKSKKSNDLYIHLNDKEKLVYDAMSTMGMSETEIEHIIVEHCIKELMSNWQ